TGRNTKMNIYIYKTIIFTVYLLCFAVHTETVNETARFLAGKGVPADSKLAEYVQSKFYAEYAGQVRSGWNRFLHPNLESMRSWQKKYPPPAYSAVFYPFGGPDITNALVLFPDAEEYLLFGLEPPGVIPDTESMQEESLTSGLNDLKLSVNTFFQVNFFITKKMEKSLGKKSFNTVTGLIIFFLAMNGCEVTDVKKIAVGPLSTAVPSRDSDDSIGWKNPPHSRVPGVEISFRRNSGRIQTVRYFMVNVSDEYLNRSSPNFLPYLKNGGRYATLIKSAAYLMHTDSSREPPPHFDRIRRFILEQSDFIIQDDSGIPLRYFPRTEWKLGFHGKYESPISLFADRLQKNLRTEMQKSSTGKLPFSYSYTYQAGKSNLMTAERIK
ncbi:MAG TPA: hypothetical protein PKK94_22770, partial [Leptospiraceae bacterium]|nr:hypothetical protein [Leptospiraceae bacterium]